MLHMEAREERIGGLHAQGEHEIVEGGERFLVQRHRVFAGERVERVVLHSALSSLLLLTQNNASTPPASAKLVPTRLTSCASGFIARKSMVRSSNGNGTVRIPLAPRPFVSPLLYSI